MKRFTVLLLTAMFLVPVSLSAQGLTNKERRHINQKILEVIDVYERTAPLYDSETGYEFKNLFVSSDASVYCDLIGTSHYQSPIKLKEYVEEAAKYTSGTLSIEILNVRKGEMTYADGVWMIPVSFSKVMSYYDKNEVLFSAKDFYDNEPYRLTLHLRYDPKDDTCLIQSIDGRLSSSKSFPTGKFKVISANDVLVGRDKMYFDKMRYNGLPLEYNDFNQAIVSADFFPETGDPDIIPKPTLKASTENYDLVTYSFQTIKNRAKLRLGIAPIMAYSLGKGSSSGVTLSRSMAFEAGLDIGTTFPVGNSKLGVYTGVALSMSNAKFAMKEGGELPAQSVLVKEDGYFYYPQTVTYNIESASESLSFKDLVIPVYMESEHRIGTAAVFVWNVGVKAYVGLDTDLGEYSVTGTRQVGSGDPVNIDGDYSLFLNPFSVDRSLFNVSAVTNLGVDLNLIQNKDSRLANKLFATIKVGYEHGILKVWESRGPNYSTSDVLFVYSPSLNGVGRDIASHSLISNVNLSRQAVWFELGIKFKM